MKQNLKSLCSPNLEPRLVLLVQGDIWCITDPVTEPAEFVLNPSLLAVLLNFAVLVYSFLETRALAPVRWSFIKPLFIVLSAAVVLGFSHGVCFMWRTSNACYPTKPNRWYLFVDECLTGACLRSYLGLFNFPNNLPCV